MGMAASAVRLLVGWLDRMAVLALLAMMLLTTSDVVLRKLINKPILGVTELVEFALGVTFFFALPGVFARGGNIAVDMIDQWLPEWGRALTTFAAMLCVLTLGLLAWHMWKPIMDAISFGDTSSDLQILKIWFLAPAWAGVVIGLFVSVFVLINGRFLPSDHEQSQGSL
jgi:TRAP-type transport system small permease protein